MSDYKTYSKGLPLSAELYWKIFPPPATHEEWANSFNKIGEINEIVLPYLADESNSRDEKHNLSK